LKNCEACAELSSSAQIATLKRILSSGSPLFARTYSRTY
jgi:hypothetical protein